VAGAADLDAARDAVQQVGVADVVLGYMVDLCRATRAAPSIELGASPRGGTSLLAASKARAALRHRIRLRHEAELEGATADSVLDAILATVPTPR
jgi:MoxR-like ATPase